MKRYLLTAVVASAWTLGAYGQPPAPASSPASSPAATRPAGLLKFPHMQLDLAQRRIVLEAEVCNPADYLLEFLLCKKDTKEYESLLRTGAQAGHLHAALLALDLTPGKPARWSAADGPGKLLPPQGPELSIRLRWKTDQGVQEADAGQWLASAGGKKLAPPKTWVFIGSQVLPDGRYLADLPEDGGIISVSNVASAVIDVPFASSSALELREYVANAKLLPPAGTPVEVVITPLGGAEKAPHARAMLEIDRLGRLRLESRPLGLEELGKWAEAYVAAHAQGQVIIRLDGLALADDLRRAREVLEQAGVKEVTEEMLIPDLPVLPRTSQQVGEAMSDWRLRMANPQQYIWDPGEQAQRTLQQIRQRQKELQAQAQLWTEYAAQLEAALRQYRSSTQPAGGTPPTQPSRETDQTAPISK